VHDALVTVVAGLANWGWSPFIMDWSPVIVFVLGVGLFGAIVLTFFGRL
jgi:hypothetical protein